jgi:hypothetical protein
VVPKAKKKERKLKRKKRKKQFLFLESRGRALSWCVCAVSENSQERPTHIVTDVPPACCCGWPSWVASSPLFLCAPAPPSTPLPRNNDCIHIYPYICSHTLLGPCSRAAGMGFGSQRRGQRRTCSSSFPTFTCPERSNVFVEGGECAASYPCTCVRR